MASQTLVYSEALTRPRKPDDRTGEQGVMPGLIRTLLLRVPAVQRQHSRIADLEMQLQQLRDQLATSRDADAAREAALEAQVNDLREQLGALATNLSEQHGCIQRLEEQLGARIAALEAAAAAPPGQTNPAEVATEL